MCRLGPTRQLGSRTASYRCCKHGITLRRQMVHKWFTDCHPASNMSRYFNSWSSCLLQPAAVLAIQMLLRMEWMGWSSAKKAEAFGVLSEFGHMACHGNFIRFLFEELILYTYIYIVYRYIMLYNIYLVLVSVGLYKWSRWIMTCFDPHTWQALSLFLG